MVCLFNSKALLVESVEDHCLKTQSATGDRGERRLPNLNYPLIICVALRRLRSRGHDMLCGRGASTVRSTIVQNETVRRLSEAGLILR